MNKYTLIKESDLLDDLALLLFKSDLKEMETFANELQKAKEEAFDLAKKDVHSFKTETAAIAHIDHITKLAFCQKLIDRFMKRI